MRIRIQYKTPEDREQVMLAYSNMTLVEEQNLIEGNFLIFDDSIGMVVISPERLEAIKKLEISQADQDELIMTALLGGN
ncbi:hypothetical protein QUF65_07970 [Lysinibacillus sphaericus]|uniref:hypothetical protein n=1 Tax=Lysinibacillus TaxID=400634 RepID=UPI00259FF722|nr:hypothetical protein [Lysinibacillus sphaericus]MDM5350816.1 hypothetical protein [Lysinibacillus sphaericus]